MKQITKLILLCLLFVIQLAIPAYMIYKSEFVISKGEVIKIRTLPVDPYDFLRGRYVQLSLEGFNKNYIPSYKRDLLKPAQAFYAILSINEDGFAYIADASVIKPENSLYLKLYCNIEGDIINPFSQFFLNQEIAPQVEKAYNQAAGQLQLDTYIKVRIKDGNGVIEDLFIDDKPILKYIEEMGKLDKAE